MITYDVLSDYDKGIIWGLGSYIESDGRFVLRHKDKYFLDRIKLYCGQDIYVQTSKDNIQYVLKSSEFDVASFESHGWSHRNAEQRDVPILDNYKEFLRAYIELHSSLKYTLRYNRKDKSSKYKALKLLVYGNQFMMSSINMILCHEVGVNLKTVQILSNGKTASLDYASIIEIDAIFDYINEKPRCESFWLAAEEKMLMPIITT